VDRAADFESAGGGSTPPGATYCSCGFAWHDSPPNGLWGHSGGHKRTCNTRPVPTYRLHDTTGDDLGVVEHPAPNVAQGDVVVLLDGREALVTARVELNPGRLAAMLEVALAPLRSPRPSRAHPAQRSACRRDAPSDDPSDGSKAIRRA
jgi:hypothetical protein